MYFRSGFTITAHHDRQHQDPIAMLRDTALRATAVTLVEGSEEWGRGKQGTFWELVVERPTLDATGGRVRLELRAHQDSAGVARAEVVTRYTRTKQNGEQQELPTFPPKVLDTITSAMSCTAGTTNLTRRAGRVRNRDAEKLIAETLLNPKRTLPILLITRQRNGRIPAHPHRLQAALLGAAEVIVLEGNSTHAVRLALGRATYGGAMRLVQPGEQPESSYHRQTPDARILIRHCLSRSLPDGFDRHHTAVRSGANDREGSGPGQSWFTTRQQPGRTEPPTLRADGQESTTAPLELGQAGLDAVTLLNHAVNICRDPLRQYVIGRMSAAYGKGVAERLAGMRNRHIRNLKKIQQSPADAIDINDLPDMVNTFNEAFQMDDRERTELSRSLREVKQARNLAAHPPVNGISREEAVDKIAVLEEALRKVNQPEKADAIGKLAHLHAKTQGSPNIDSE